MTYFAGLDVSLEATSVCVIDATGKVVGERKVESSPEAIAGYLEGTELSFARVGLEAGQLAPWLYQGLREAGLAAICIDGRIPSIGG